MQHATPNNVALKFAVIWLRASVGLAERTFDFDQPFHPVILWSFSMVAFTHLCPGLNAITLCCLISTSYLTGLFLIFILLHI